MACRSTTTVASNYSWVNPSYWLFVTKFNSCVWLWLQHVSPSTMWIVFHELTWSSIIVCSNLGPDMASSRGIWLFDQTPFLFGAWSCRCFSASSTDSCNGASDAPKDVTAVSFVSDTLGVNLRGLGSLAWLKFSPVPGPCRRSWAEEVNVLGLHRTTLLPVAVKLFRTQGRMADMLSQSFVGNDKLLRSQKLEGRGCGGVANRSDVFCKEGVARLNCS